MLITSLAVSLGKFRYIRQIAIILAIVKTVADNEIVRDGEQRIVSLEVHHSPVRLVKKRYYVQGSFSPP